jgi:phosphate transport system substrate-binding protein
MHRRLVVVLFVLALLDATPVSSRSEGFSGAGSTFAYPALARWGQVFATLQGEAGAFVSADANLDYEPVGSLAGVMRVLHGAVDFGVTDVPMAPDELDRHGLSQFPLISGGVAVVVNLQGIGGTVLRLSGSVLTSIYLGEIRRWSDPQIQALNPDLTLPDAAIAVIHRLDGSGTTYHFAGYLAAASPTWRDRIGVNTLLTWPVGSGARGNAELADRVRTTANAIGYVEASQAARLGLSVVHIENRHGRFLAPDTKALTAALATAGWDPVRHFHRNDAEHSDAAAYPIVATAFVLLPRRPGSAARGRQVLEFFRFALTERAADAALLGYVPLPETTTRQIADYWRSTIRGAR